MRNAFVLVRGALIPHPLPRAASALVKGSWASGNFKVDKLQVGSDKKITGEFTMVNAVADTNLSFKATDGTRAAGAEAVTAVIGLVNSGKSHVATVDVDALKYTADASLVFVYDGFLVGGQTKAALKAGAPDLQDYNVLLGYKDKSLTAAAVTDKKATGVTVGLISVVSPVLTVAAQAKFPLAFKQASAFDVEAGLAYKVAADTTVHAKASSAGKVAVSYKQALNSMASVTFAGQVDAANIGSDDHAFGINLALTA